MRHGEIKKFNCTKQPHRCQVAAMLSRVQDLVKVSCARDNWPEEMQNYVALELTAFALVGDPLISWTRLSMGVISLGKNKLRIFSWLMRSFVHGEVSVFFCSALISVCRGTVISEYRDDNTFHSCRRNYVTFGPSSLYKALICLFI